ncbi:restriction endonuclease subunit S [Sutcliffiella sp. NC1]|uniref:restriction endonuclease subunit S n=1 Tax=Sutcliffiella sp. NC1 TaxID=3004096 RepID=UPI0022DD8D8D|nr:restriction endonuclease subunit S [Sutcliffiella sp. NC1]WBL15230.1 restriction endonuclease subunit S [Sutcliffiella sp. NC1]
MTSKWKIYTLHELYTISSGLSKKREEFGFGYPFLTFKEVFHNPIVPNELPELANTTDKERERCSIKRGDVFLTRTSEKLDELGLSSVALKDYPNATFNGFTKRLRPNGKCVELLIPEYVAFYLRSAEFRNQVTSFASMTTRASLNNEMISKLTIKVPPLTIQKQIADTMINLLLKEETNKNAVHLLEQIAQTLFKYWFIDFEFPNEDGLPYKSNGGKMVESELGEIPERWKVGELQELANKLYAGGTPSRKKEEYWLNGNIPWLKTKEIKNKYIINAEESITKQGLEGSSAKWIPPHSVVVAMYGATAGQLGYLAKEMTSNQACCAIVSDIPNFIYSYLRLNQERLRDLATGSAQQNLSKDVISKFKIICPLKDILITYETIVTELSEQIIELTNENNSLEQLRDTLLPELLSGEIEIPEESVVG